MNIKCGIEVHQRLNTSKLFCHCYSDPNKPVQEKEAKIARTLRPAVGELGQVDIAALFESEVEKTYEYTVGEKTSCLVEVDEEPPAVINSEARTLCLQVAKALQADIVNEIHVMRKTIIDGSTVSGFQRTALVAVNGQLKVGEKDIGIQTICLEEESSRIIEKQDAKHAAYGLDRQGIPLIEIATAPFDVDSPELVKKVALELGEILRNTGKVQRGIGTIRQDINISINEGERIEIKGCQDLALIPELVKNEATRQTKLLEIKDKLIERGAKPVEKIIDISPIFKNTQSKIISNGLAGGAKVMALKLDGFGGLLSMQITPGFSFGRELEDHAKLSGAKGTMHSDENLNRFGVSDEEKKTVAELLAMTNEDTFIMCMDSETITKKALNSVFQRCVQAKQGVPKETRKVERGVTRFMRPLAGAARMYPETDSQPIIITAAHIAELKEIETPDKKISRYKQLGLNEELATRMASHPRFQLFEEAIKKTRCDVSTVAVTLLETLTALRREGIKVDEISDEKIITVLVEYGEGTIAKTGIPALLKLVCQEPQKSISKIIQEHNLQRIDGDGLRKIALECNGDIAVIMKRFKANIDANQLNQVIRELKAAGKLEAKPS